MIKFNQLGKKEITLLKIVGYFGLLIISVALIFIETDDTQSSQKSLQKSHTKKAQTARSINLKAYQFIEEKKYKEAANEFYKVVYRYRNNHNITSNEQLAYAFVNLAWCLQKIGKHKEAIETVDNFLNRFKGTKNQYILNSKKRANYIKKQSSP